MYSAVSFVLLLYQPGLTMLLLNLLFFSINLSELSGFPRKDGCSTPNDVHNLLLKNVI